jgi:hypothetical protein
VYVHSEYCLLMLLLLLATSVNVFDSFFLGGGGWDD